MAEFRLEVFDSNQHHRSDFDCGNSALNDYLRKLATQYERRHLGKTVVALRSDGSDEVVGYYVLSASSVAFVNMPLEVARKLPAHPVPMVLLARLAVDRKEQGKGLGKILLHNALRRALDASALVGVFAIEVFATDQLAADFYGKFGFLPLPDDSRHFYLPTTTIAAALARLDCSS
jgi:GNAT superfamily N-acetyltransferase